MNIDSSFPNWARTSPAATSSTCWSRKASKSPPTRASSSWKPTRRWSKSLARMAARSSSSTSRRATRSRSASAAHARSGGGNRPPAEAGNAVDGSPAAAYARYERCQPGRNRRRRTPGRLPRSAGPRRDPCRPARPRGGWPGNWASIWRRVHGSGPHGRITPEDVQAPCGRPHAAPAAGARRRRRFRAGRRRASRARTPGARSAASGCRRSAARSPSRWPASASTIPHVTNFDDADVTDLEPLRAGVPAGYLGQDIKLTLDAVCDEGRRLGPAPAPGRQRQPRREKEQIIYKQYVNLGVAVDTPRGLVVPVVRNVDRMTIAELAQALASLAERARAAQFAVEDLRGGTLHDQQHRRGRRHLQHADHQSSRGGGPAVGPLPLAARWSAAGPTASSRG